MRTFIVILFSLVLFSACVEDFDLKVKDGEPRLVVEGLITNQPGPYYVRLTKSTPGGLTSTTALTFRPKDNVEPVENATVIISDDFNQIDTLKPYKVDILGGDYGENSYNQGFYKTTRLKGIQEHTYNLKIISEGKEYQASAYMPPVPEIDSLGYYLKKSELVGKSDYYIPLLYFKEPQSINNYYLIQLHDDFLERIFASSFLWQFSILTDTFLEPYVNGLNVSRGATPRGIDSYPVYQEEDSIYVALSSLTKEAFNYYKNLLDQFDSDGGAYKPTPASPPGNISNGALGLFRASAVSVKRTKIDHNRSSSPSINIKI
jgi:hypothetical protein